MADRSTPRSPRPPRRREARPSRRWRSHLRGHGQFAERPRPQPRRRHTRTSAVVLPPEAAELIAAVNGHAMSTLDPTAGDGSLLAGVDPEHRFGIEIDADQVKAGTYEAIHGDVQRAYPLLRVLGTRFPRIACNPPFGLDWRGPRQARELHRRHLADGDRPARRRWRRRLHRRDATASPRGDAAALTPPASTRWSSATTSSRASSCPA